MEEQAREETKRGIERVPHGRRLRVTQEEGASPSPTKEELDGFALRVGCFGVGWQGIEPQEFGIVVQESEVWVTASPNRISGIE